MRGSLVFLWMMFSLVSVPAQEHDALKEWIELNPELVLDEDALQGMMEWMQHKRDINRVAKEDLSALLFIDETLAAAIIRHREQSGPYQSLFELQVIPGMNKEIYQLLIRTLSVNGRNQNGASNAKLEYIGLFQVHNPNKRGYKEAIYAGKPLRQWHRVKMRVHPNWKLGFSMENDAGESCRWNSQQKGFDFGTAYLEYGGRRNWQVIIGDYRLKVGQGLTLGLGNNFGSSTWVGRVYSNDGAKAYRGSDENLFLRGVYLKRKAGPWDFSIYASSLKSDGRKDGESISESGTGLHRSESERELRKQFQRRALGATVSYGLKNGEIGMTQLFLHENRKPQHQTSVFYRKSIENLLLFGESSFGNFGWSILQSFVYSANKQLDFSALFRSYPRENENPFTGGFSRFSANENERGLYVSAEYQTIHKQKWKLFADWAYRPFPSFLVSRAYWATQYFLETEKRLRQSTLQCRIQWKEGEKDGATEQASWKQTQVWKSLGVRLHASFALSESLSFSCRLHQEWYRNAAQNDKGVLFFQDIQWRPKRAKYYLILRYTRFVIPSYDTRIYAYESDVLYAFSIPNYSGAGQRAYAVIRIPIFKGMDAWIKLGYTWYTSKTSIGSQWEEVNSNQQMDLKFLLRYRF